MGWADDKQRSLGRRSNAPRATPSIFMTSLCWEVPPMIIWCLWRVNFYPLGIAGQLGPRWEKSDLYQGFQRMTAANRVSDKRGCPAAGALPRSGVQTQWRGESLQPCEAVTAEWCRYLFEISVEGVTLRDSCFGKL